MQGCIQPTSTVLEFILHTNGAGFQISSLPETYLCETARSLPVPLEQLLKLQGLLSWASDSAVMHVGYLGCASVWSLAKQ